MEVLPNLAIPGEKISREAHIEKHTNLLVFLGMLVSALVLFSVVLSSMGIFLLVIPFYFVFKKSLEKTAEAKILSNGIRVSTEQFPEIYECAAVFAERLGINDVPDIYIVEDNVQNGFAVKFGKKNSITLTDDLIHACLQSNEPKSLSFVIAHEMAHIAYKHTGMVRSYIRSVFKPLSRKDEYSCDSAARALVGDKNIAYMGLLVLTTGHKMLPFLNQAEIIRQLEDIRGNKYVKKAEKTSTHPALMNRMIRVLEA